MCKCDFCDFCEKIKINYFYTERICSLSPNGQQQKDECKKAEEKFRNTIK